MVDESLFRSLLQIKITLLAALSIGFMTFLAGISCKLIYGEHSFNIKEVFYIECANSKLLSSTQVLKHSVHCIRIENIVFSTPSFYTEL